jgi:NAD(P)-dependent dehydrogenase (short-subunit alcohol dehydrogenase family)
MTDTVQPQHRIALVTGAGSGIGRAVTLALLSDGWSVTLAGRRREPLDETVRLAATDPTLTLVQTADVADPASVGTLFSAIATRFGRLDLLFNNAGLNVAPTPFEDIPVEDWNQVVSVNLTGMFLCAQAAFRMMKTQTPRGGRIINNGSISAYAPRPDAAPYTVTKHGVTGLTKTLSLDGRAHDIACGQIDIGNAATSLAAKMQTGAKQAAGHIAIEPMMDVRDVGRSVAFMASMPLDTNIPFLTVMANAMPFLGRG